MNRELNDVLAQAKAIRFAAAHGGLTYEQAKTKVEELLKVVNEVGREIAKRYGRKYRKIRFTDL